MTAQTVTQAWMLAQAYREKYEQYLPVLQHNIPGATASVHDDHFPITAINQLAYAFMIMANTDVKVGYSAEIAIRARGQNKSAWRTRELLQGKQLQSAKECYHHSQ